MFKNVTFIWFILVNSISLSSQSKIPFWIDGGINGWFIIPKHEKSMTWIDAKDFCKNLCEGARLAEIHNIETQNLLSSKLNGKGTFWLGATDSKSVIFIQYSIKYY